MTNYNRAETIKKFVNKIISGQMEFSHLRKVLENQSLKSEEINIVLRQVDKRVTRAARMKEINDSGKNLFYGGLMVALLGVIFTIGTFTGFLDFKGIGILAYGPIAGGLITAMAGKSQMNRN
ncbi:hypothetical protein [Maribacter sp. Asnod2-G09]|uniref:hypothetical protein n=1 Tax=Maribacter sp. Asnod2-G09 TaxID=3160577 RepID=UPI00386409D2